jgi:hypothetical protein
MFLSSDNLCGVHSELGGFAKPAGCQFFPYQAVRTPGGTFFSQSFACPPVVAGKDRNAEANRQELAELLRRFPDSAADLPDLDFPVRLTQERDISWPSYLRLEARLLADYDAQHPLDSLLELAYRTMAAGGGEERVESWPSLKGAVPDPQFLRELLLIYLTSITSILENESNPAGRAGYGEAMLSGGLLPSCYMKGLLPSLDLDRRMSEQTRQLFHRYFRNRLVGKTLLSPSIVAGLLATAIAYAMLTFYAEGFRLDRGEQEITLEALTLAFEVVEADAVSHSRVMAPFFIDFEATLGRLAA